MLLSELEQLLANAQISRNDPLSGVDYDYHGTTRYSSRAPFNGDTLVVIADRMPKRWGSYSLPLFKDYSSWAFTPESDVRIARSQPSVVHHFSFLRYSKKVYQLMETLYDQQPWQQRQDGGKLSFQFTPSELLSFVQEAEVQHITLTDSYCVKVSLPEQAELQLYSRQNPRTGEYLAHGLVVRKSDIVEVIQDWDTLPNAASIHLVMVQKHQAF